MDESWNMQTNSKSIAITQLFLLEHYKMGATIKKISGTAHFSKI